MLSDFESFPFRTQTVRHCPYPFSSAFPFHYHSDRCSPASTSMEEAEYMVLASTSISHRIGPVHRCTDSLFSCSSPSRTAAEGSCGCIYHIRSGNNTGSLRRPFSLCTGWGHQTGHTPTVSAVDPLGRTE